jgi:ribosomal protein S18 acetylase RimI-like enzyme
VNRKCQRLFAAEKVSPMNINIRKAGSDDVRFVIPMIYASGPHEFDYVFNVGNKTTQDYLSFAFPTQFGGQSYQFFTVATVHDQVVGVCAFYSGRDHLRLNLGNVWNIVRFYGLRNFIRIAQRGLQMESIIPPPEVNSGFINQLGVKEGFRGSGIGTLLTQHHIELTRKMGLKKCTLDVAMTNPRAQALYERLGFKVVQENAWKHLDSSIHVPGQRRMEFVME